MAKFRYKALDSFRGVWAVLIYLHHFLPSAGANYIYDFGHRGVLFFFVLSGFVMTCSYRDRVTALDWSYEDYLIRRCAKLFPIQWLTVLVSVIFGLNVVTYWAIPFHLTLTQSYIPLWQIDFTLNAASWFLSSILFCYILFPVVLKFIIKDLKKSILVYVIVLLAFSFMIIFLPGSIGRRWLTYLNPGARFLDFILGMFIALASMRGAESTKYKSTLGGNVLEIFSVIMIVGCVVFNPKHDWPIVWLYPFVGFMIFVFSQERGVLSMLLARSKVLLFLGSVSLPLYLIQGFVYPVCIKYLHVNIVMSFVASFSLTVLFAYILQKFFIPYSSKLFVLFVKKASQSISRFKDVLYRSYSDLR